MPPVLPAEPNLPSAASGVAPASRLWRGVIAEYADRLPAHVQQKIVTLGEGGTPLVPAPALSERTGAEVYVKVEGMNPTGSFKDRGMTMAISRQSSKLPRTWMSRASWATAWLSLPIAILPSGTRTAAVMPACAA